MTVLGTFNFSQGHYTMNLFITSFLTYFSKYFPIPVDAPSNAWACGRSHAGIVGSNLAVDMVVSLLCVFCVAR